MRAGVSQAGRKVSAIYKKRQHRGTTNPDDPAKVGTSGCAFLMRGGLISILHVVHYLEGTSTRREGEGVRSSHAPYKTNVSPKF